MGGFDTSEMKYFQEFYEDRVKTIHPVNKFGESPFSPIMHDDFSHLRRSLRSIFAFIVLGDHGPDFYEEVKRNKELESRVTNN